MLFPWQWLQVGSGAGKSWFKKWVYQRWDTAGKCPLILKVNIWSVYEILPKDSRQNPGKKGRKPTAYDTIAAGCKTKKFNCVIQKVFLFASSQLVCCVMKKYL